MTLLAFNTCAHAISHTLDEPHSIRYQQFQCRWAVPAAGESVVEMEAALAEAMEVEMVAAPHTH